MTLYFGEWLRTLRTEIILFQRVKLFLVRVLMQKNSNTSPDNKAKVGHKVDFKITLKKSNYKLQIVRGEVSRTERQKLVIA